MLVEEEAIGAVNLGAVKASLPRVVCSSDIVGDNLMQFGHTCDAWTAGWLSAGIPVFIVGEHHRVRRRLIGRADWCPTTRLQSGARDASDVP